jgi:signal transduction histidine kinase
VGLASAAGVAIENARLHGKLHELAIIEDRDRIARDLHDTVIQRLFATGMSLQGSARLVATDPQAAIDRIDDAVNELDLTVKHIRTAIFGLEVQRATRTGLRDQVLALAREAQGTLGFIPGVLFEGAVDSGTDDQLRVELVGTLREALANVARHASATRVDIAVIVGDGVCLRVVDNGIGPPADDAPRGDGLRNMAARAERLGGRLSLVPGDPSGTVLEWHIPAT